VNAVAGTTDQLEPPLVEISSVPASKQVVVLSKAKVCQNERVELACVENAGDTRTLSDGSASLAENQECVGDCDRAVDNAQSLVPASTECDQPGLSKPPAPSKVSFSVLVAVPVGAALRITEFASSIPFEESTARTA